MDGYVNFRGSCLQCTANCRSCYESSPSTCITCNTGYEIGSDGSKCKISSVVSGSSTKSTSSNVVFVKDEGFKNFHYIIIGAGVVYLLALIAGIIIKCRTDSFCDSQLKPYQDYSNLPAVPMPGGPLPIYSAGTARAEPMQPVTMTQKLPPAMPPGFQ